MIQANFDHSLGSYLSKSLIQSVDSNQRVPLVGEGEEIGESDLDFGEDPSEEILKTIDILI